MADDEYTKKLGELQKYVPFLENTIKRLKTETGKPREAQISKLQSLLVILTNTKKKLKLDALKKCEEVILKLYDKVEKKVPVEDMHKYMCRTPPGDKPLTDLLRDKVSQEKDLAFTVAREKLNKQAEFTPASPSPPPNPILASKPVVIPTEKVVQPIVPIPVINTTFNIPPPSCHFQRDFIEDGWCNNFNDSAQKLNWPRQAFNRPPLIDNRIPIENINRFPIPNDAMQRPPFHAPQNWPQNEPMMYQRRTDMIRPTLNTERFHVWDRKNDGHERFAPPCREIINYSDTFPDKLVHLEKSPKPVPKPVLYPRNNKEIIPILDLQKTSSKEETTENIPDAPRIRNLINIPLIKADNVIEKTLKKPPLTESDLKDLLSPVTESSTSGEQSPEVNEDMDLDKLEELKEKLYKELAENKKTEDPPKNSNKSSVAPQSTKPKNSAKVVERVVKEQANLFGSILSSIDEQLIVKKNKNPKKTDSKKDVAKKEEQPKKDPKKIEPRENKEKNETKGKDSKTKDISKSKDNSSSSKSDVKHKDKSKSKDNPRKSSSGDESSTVKVKDDSKVNDSKSHTESKSNKDDTKNLKNKKDDKDSKSKSKNDLKPKSSTKSKESTKDDKDKPKRLSTSKEATDSKPKEKVSSTVDKIMKNLKESIKDDSKSSLTSEQTLHKFGNSVRDFQEKYASTDSSNDKRNHSHSSNDSKEDEKAQQSGRLSDKYPHKRKPSIDTQKPQNEPTKLKNTEVHPLKLADPRIRNSLNFTSPPHTQSFPAFPEQPDLHMNFPQNEFASDANFPFPNNSPQMRNNFCGDPNTQIRGRPPMFPNDQPIRPPSIDQFQQHGGMTPGDPFLNNPGDQFINSGNMTPVDPFLNAGNMTPGDPFLNPGNMTPGDPFLNQGNMTPGDPFMNAGNMTPADPFLNNFDQFPGEHNQPRNSHPFPGNNFNNAERNPDQFWNRNNQTPDQFHMQRNNQFDRPPNNFPDMPGPDFQNPPNRFQNFNHSNQMFHNPNQNLPPNFQNMLNKTPDQSNNFNQYDLSQMTPIDFYDTNHEKCKDKRLLDKGNRNFRGRGSNNRGPFRGRGNMDRNAFSWTNPNRRLSCENPKEDYPRKAPLLPLPPRFASPIDEPKDDSYKKRFSSTEVPRDRKFGSRYSHDETKHDNRNRNETEHSASYRKFCRYFTEDKKEDTSVRKHPSSSYTKDELAKKPAEENVEQSEKDLKEKEEICSPLNSLYSTEKKQQVGKGYGIQKFKIPKIKKPVVEIKKDAKEIKTEEITKPIVEDEILKNTDDEQKPEIVIEDLKQPEEIVKKIEVKTPETEEKVDKNVSSSSDNKSEADEKLDMFNNFMKHIFDTCDSSVLLQYLDKCGFALPKAKTKRIRRIIESDSEGSEDEHKVTTESEKPIPEPIKKEVTTVPEEEIKVNPEESIEPPPAETIIESVGERIKSRRRKPIISTSSESSPEKSSAAAGSGTEPEPEEKPTTEKNKSPAVKKHAKTRRKNALELLQDDIREMFISKGVLTATGKRMCRMMKEHQESGIYSEIDSPTKNKEIPLATTEDEEDMPLTRRKLFKSKTAAKTKSAKSQNETVPASSSQVDLDPVVVLPTRIQPKRNRSTPRVVLEKLEISPTVESSAESSDNEADQEPEEEEIITPRPVRRRTRRRITSTSTDLTETHDSSIKSDKKKVVKEPVKNPKSKPLEKSPETDKESETKSIAEEPADKPEPVKKRSTVKKKPKRRSWAMGVIKKTTTKANKTQDKTLSSPSLSSTEISDQLSIPETINDSEIADMEKDLPETDPQQPATSTGSDNDELSLLKIDLNPDVNYFLDNGNKFDCKLCLYKGKLIVHHYRTRHPESENMISRLSPEQAKAAITEAEQNNFEEIIPYEEVVKIKKKRTTFECRFCFLAFKEITANFFDHICCHTGEYRYACEMCSFYTGFKKTLSAHCHNLHPELKKPLMINPTYPAPPNFRLVFGYICQACNFTQLLKPNVEKHIKVSHPDKEVAIIKISMSSKSVPLNDLKPIAENLPATVTEPDDSESEIPIASITRELKLKTPELPKEPDMTVFMVTEDTSKQEKIIEDERLKKMQEVITTITPRRSTLQFVDKLKTKLESVQQDADAIAAALELHEELHIEDVPEEIIPEEIIATPDPPSDKWIEIASTCSLAEASVMDQDPVEPEPIIEQSNDISFEIENTSDNESLGEVEETLDMSNVDLSLPVDSKQKGVLDTIQRLAAKLKSPSKTPQTPQLDNLESSMIPSDNLNISDSTQDQIINVGAIEVNITNQKHKYICLVPDCEFSTFYKISFTNHCGETHPKLIVTCDICNKTEPIIKSFTMTSLFLHLFDRHKISLTDSSTQLLIQQSLIAISEPEIIQPGKIRIRRISGDVLSSFPSNSITNTPTTVEKPETQIAILDQPDLNPVEPQKEEPLGFFQISDVRTLTLEEENNLQSKGTNLIPVQTPKKEERPNSKLINTASYQQALIAVPGLEFAMKSTMIVSKKKTLLPVSGISKISNNATMINVKKVLSTGDLPASYRFKKIDKQELEDYLKTLDKPKADCPVPYKHDPSKILKANKPTKIFTEMIKFPKITDLYKCPLQTCSYSTSMKQQFSVHFAAHNAGNIGFFCVYCTILVRTGNLLLHIEKFHGLCLYQCAFCFFRAVVPSYVTVHQKTAHQIETPKYYSMVANPGISTMKDIVPIPRKKAILPYICSQDGCKNSFLFTKDFMIHLRLFHKKFYLCAMCEQSTRFTNAVTLVRHNLVHCIGQYQCRFCVYASETADVMHQHYAKIHTQLKPIAYMRQFASGLKALHYSDEARMQDIAEVDLDTIKAVPEESPLEEDTELSNASTSSITNDFEEKPSTVTSQSISPSEPTSESIEMIDVTYEMSENPAEILTESEDLNEPLVTLKHRNDASRDAIVNAVDPLNVDCESQFSSNNEEFEIGAVLNLDLDKQQGLSTEESSSDLKIAEEEDEQFFEDTGLTGFDLYTCGSSDCLAKATNLKDFKNHMYSCDVLTNDGGWYTCYHCKKRFKFVGGLTDHMQVHGLQRYSCSLCPVRSHLARLIIKHVKCKHKIKFVKLVQVDPTNDRFICMPTKGKKSKKERKSSDSPVPEDPPKSDELSIFGPEDIDLLPRPPVYANEIKCKLCLYNTKVRSNMQRHLQQHIDEKAVPETAPVNPVPCLEKNEMMFDKMTNLAASSHTGRMGAKIAEKTEKTGTKNEPNNSFPCFIPANKRYVCGAEGCNYLTHIDTMFRHHLTALHLNEPSYKCPHCKQELSTAEIDGMAIDNILFHLKMHDLHLYQCSSCPFYHYQRHKIEKHRRDNHPSLQVNHMITIRELDTSANFDDFRQGSATAEPQPTAEVPADAVSKPWRCGFCAFKCPSRTEIITHASQVHDIKSQFKCGLCHFRCSAKNNYSSHFKTKHPNEEVNIFAVFYKIADENNAGATTAPVLEETQSEASTSSSKSFDTTPLWSKNKSGVKHIRGILLDEVTKPTKRSTPKIIEKLSEIRQTVQEEPIPTLESPVKTSSPEKKDEKKDERRTSKRLLKSMETDSLLMKFPTSFGQAEENLYVCPVCTMFKSKRVKEFVLHLYTEMNYYRCACNYCNFKTQDITQAKKHHQTFHEDEPEDITVLRHNVHVERWVEKCAQHQLIDIKKFEEELETFDDSANSSTETITLHLHDDEPDPEETAIIADDNSMSSPETESEKVVEAEEPETSNLKIDGNEDVDSQSDVETLKDLKETINEKKSAEVKEEDKPTSEDIKPEISKPISNLQCEHCLFVSKNIHSLRKHTKRHFSFKPFHCKLCQYQSFVLPSMYQHFQAKHPNEMLQYDVIPKPDEPQFRLLKRKRPLNEIPDQDEPVSKVPMIEKPIEEIVEAQKEEDDDKDVKKVSMELDNPDLVDFYICFHCPRRSECLDTIRVHFLKIHEKQHKGVFKYKKIIIDKRRKSKYSCNYCSWFGDPNGLKQHHMDNHNDKLWVCQKAIKYKCVACQRIFSKLNALRKHYTQIHPNKNLSYQSIIDDETEECLDTVEIYEEPIDLKPKPNLINCDYCPDTFAGPLQLQSHHNLLHSHLELKLEIPKEELKRFKCPQCNHASNSYPAMRDHLRSHNKPYKCGYCPLTGSYPNILKTHHVKEHRNLELSIELIPDAQKLNEILRDNLLYLGPDGTYSNEKPKRMNKETLKEEPPQKKRHLDLSLSDESDFTVKKTNVARKSTSLPPIRTYVAKKSTTPRPPDPSKNEGYSFYGTKPADVNEYKNVMSEINIMGKPMPLNVVAMSHVLNLFPTVVLRDINKTESTT